MIIMEDKKLNTWKNIKKDSDQLYCTHVLNADNMVDTVRETSSRKAIDSIKPKENILVFKNAHIPDCLGEGSTSQIVFNDF